MGRELRIDQTLLDGFGYFVGKAIAWFIIPLINPPYDIIGAHFFRIPIAYNSGVLDKIVIFW